MIAFLNFRYFGMTSITGQDLLDKNEPQVQSDLTSIGLAKKEGMSTRSTCETT
jgi:hypothetical protein